MNEHTGLAAVDDIPRTLTLRPGERPAWIELSLDRAVTRRLRAIAQRSRLPLGAAVALALEAELVAADLGDMWADVVAEATSTVIAPRLAPDDRLRNWVRQLRDGVEPSNDELPSLALPARLLAQIPPGERVRRVLEFDPAVLKPARVVDAAAALHGTTMQVWSLQQALRLATR